MHQGPRTVGSPPDVKARMTAAHPPHDSNTSSSKKLQQDRLKTHIPKTVSFVLLFPGDLVGWEPMFENLDLILGYFQHAIQVWGIIICKVSDLSGERMLLVFMAQCTTQRLALKDAEVKLLVFWLCMDFVGITELRFPCFPADSPEQPPLFGKERNSLWMETFFFQIHRAYGNEVGGNPKTR